jgi:hypothetical protein
MWRYSFIFCMPVIVFACSGIFCGNDLVSESISTDGKYVASVFERNCGATTPYVQVVSLRLSNTKLNPENHDDWVFTIHGKSKVELFWENANRLNISYTGTGDKPTERDSWKNVTITYN